MSAKSILLLGLIISALFIYLCIDSKKNELYTQLVEKKEPKNTTSSLIPKKMKEKVLAPIAVKKDLKEASFAYVAGEKIKIAAIFSKEDNTSEIISGIEKICEKNLDIILKIQKEQRKLKLRKNM